MKLPVFALGTRGAATPLSSWGAEGYSWAFKSEGEEQDTERERGI